MVEAKKPSKKSIPFIEILKQAGKIVWENRFLLWFGFLMALGSPGSFNIGRNERDFSGQEETARNFFESHWQLLVFLIVILFVIGLLLFLISLIAKAGLVKSINLITKNKQTSFKLGWQSGKKYLSKLFGLSILFFLAIFVIIAVLSVPVVYLVASQSWVSAVLVGILAIAIFIPLVFIFSITKIYAEFYIILSNLNIRNALETGYELLLKNIGNSIVFSLLLVAVSLVAGIVLLPVVGFALLILVPTGIAFYYLSKITFAIFLGFAILLFLLVVLFVSSIFQTYKTTAWTLFFQEIARAKKPELELAAEELEKTVATRLEKA